MELKHYGVVGMRWGIRRHGASSEFAKASKKLDKAKVKAEKAGKKLRVRAARKTYLRARGNKIQDSHSIMDGILNARSVKATRKVEKLDRAMSRAFKKVPMTAIAKSDLAAGEAYISKLRGYTTHEAAMSYIYHGEDGIRLGADSSAALMHYGRKGMKWGQHIYATTEYKSDAVRAVKLSNNANKLRSIAQGRDDKAADAARRAQVDRADGYDKRAARYEKKAAKESKRAEDAWRSQKDAQDRLDRHLNRTTTIHQKDVEQIFADGVQIIEQRRKDRARGFAIGAGAAAVLSGAVMVRSFSTQPVPLPQSALSANANAILSGSGLKKW